MNLKNHSWKLWVFVFGLNLLAIGGAFYLRSIGIDLYSFRAPS